MVAKKSKPKHVAKPAKAKAKIAKVKSVAAKVKPVKKPVAKSQAVKSQALKSQVKSQVVKSIGKITKPFTKSELLNNIVGVADLNRKQVVAVFDRLQEIIAAHLKKDSPEKFIFPGLLKIVVKKVPAKPAREGRNPFNGEIVMFKAKPATKKVRVIPLSGLKGMC